jgi:hypothetical protein
MGVFKFYNRFVEIVKDLSKKDYIFYGNDNLLPNKLLRYINESGTAKQCVTKIAEYIEADGFVSDLTALHRFNKEQKGDDFLSDIAQQDSIFSAFALLVKRNGFDEEVEAEVLPFDKIRRDKTSGYWYNPNVGNIKYKENEWQFYPTYNPKATNVAATYPQGEIAYFYRKSADNPYYPIPDYYAGIEDIITSSELSKMDLEMSLNGFMTSGIITFIGNPNQVIEGSRNMTLLQHYDEMMQEFTGQVKNADGFSGRMSLMTTWANSKEEAPVLQTLDAKAIIDASNAKRDAINRDVCRLFKVHPVLIGFSEATVLGNQQALSNAQKILIDTVNPMQRFITDSLKSVFPKFDFTISQKAPVAVADSVLLEVLTEDEKRRIFWGLEPKEIKIEPNVNI